MPIELFLRDFTILSFLFSFLYLTLLFRKVDESNFRYEEYYQLMNDHVNDFSDVLCVLRLEVYVICNQIVINVSCCIVSWPLSARQSSVVPFTVVNCTSLLEICDVIPSKPRIQNEQILDA